MQRRVGSASLVLLLSAATEWPTPPYGRSELTASIDYGRTVYTGVPSDTWPSVWAGSGASFAMGGDMAASYHPGQGGGSPISNYSYTNSWRLSPDGRRAVSVELLNRFPVPLAEMRAVCSNGSSGPFMSTANLKAVSMVGIGRTVYAAVQCQHYQNDEDPAYPGCQIGLNTWLIASRDGASWRPVTGYRFFSGRLANPQFIQAGRAQAGAPDRYVYVHFGVSKFCTRESGCRERSCMFGNDYVLLARVVGAGLTDRAQYQWWAGAGRWSALETEATAVFAYEQMVGSPHSFYNPGLKRYMLPNFGSLNRTGHPWSNNAGPRGASSPGHTAQLALYEAEAPWGPWRLMLVHNEWEWDGAGAYSPEFPQQWISADGRSLVMVSTACCNQTTVNARGEVGRANNYQFHATPVTLHGGE